MVKCPMKCDTEPIVLFGYKQFSVNSKICQAGLLMGVVFPYSVGSFLIKRGIAIRV